MEPLSTFFRISPTLLTQTTTTPRSQSSSTFSSPSFADHQTGLKVYRDSPASLNSAHQDNPLFEGFPVLPPGERRSGKAADTAANVKTPGGSPKLQEQLHHLLSVLQHALELHNADGLPDDVAPQLADELEAVAKKLKDKERETPAERQLRAKVQLALTGAEATIRKLRATPTRASPVGLTWRCNDTAATSPTAAVPSGTRTSTGADLSTDPACGGSVRDSVCRQLLQSPSSSLSPLSWNGPTAATGTPMVVDDASMASPKELPMEQHKGQARHVPDGSACEHVRIPTGIPLLPQRSCSSSEGGAASTSTFQPPLYEWMKAVLASASKNDEVVPRNSIDGATRRNNGVSSPPAAGAPGDGLAAAVRAALSNTRTPPLIYGTPLHRRIQRLLADQRSPSPLRHVAAQTGAAQYLGSVAPTPIGGIGAVHVRRSRLAWDRDTDTDSPSFSNRFTDTSSSCTTPMTANQDGLGRLPLSPFGPPLRERYGRSCSTTAMPPDVGTEATATSKPSEPAVLLSGAEEQVEAAELVAELGLDLQLDPATAGSISNLEVLVHVERWAREQFIAAKRALQATKQPDLEEDGGNGTVGFSGQADSGSQALVDIGIQTEPEDVGSGDHELLNDCASSTARDTEAITAVQTRRTNAKDKPWVSSARVQVTDPREGPDLAGYGGLDAKVDVCSPSRSDQSKRSPHSHREKYRDAPTANGRDTDVTDFSVLPAGTRSCPDALDANSTPARRGLFPSTTSVTGSCCGADLAQLVNCGGAPLARCAGDMCGPTIATLDASSSLPGGDGLLSAAAAVAVENDLRGGSWSYKARSMMTGWDASLPDPPRPVTPTCQADPVSPVSMSRTGQAYSFAGPVATSRAQSDDNLAPEVLFTPGVSSGASKAAAGRHISRLFQAGGANAHARALAAELSEAAGAAQSSSRTQRGTAGLPGENPPNTARVEDGSAPPSSRRRHCPGADPASPQPSGGAEIAPEVLFTPGNARAGPGAKVLCDRRVRLPFRLDAAARPEDEETGDGEASAQTLSSISSVSIIASEPANALHEAGDDSRAGPGGARSQKPGSLSQHLRGFFTSLLPCAHGSKAS